MDLLSSHWLMVQLELPNTPALTDFTDRTIADHVRLLLGDDVWGLTAEGGVRKGVTRPSWNGLLNYHDELYPHAIKDVNMKGLTLAAALEARRKRQ